MSPRRTPTRRVLAFPAPEAAPVPVPDISATIGEKLEWMQPEFPNGFGVISHLVEGMVARHRPGYAEAELKRVAAELREYSK